MHRLLLLLTTSSLVFAANPFQPVINPNGVVNSASNLSSSFVNYGIARGSLFVIYGSALGPVDLVSAPGFPLPTTDGLAGTRVLVNAGGYNATCPMVYTSLTQVAAIMPSDAPEGDATVVVVYQNMASTATSIKIVRSAFGIFTRNQGGSGPAIVQNFVSATDTPLNSLLAPARNGQTMILWGTGLGPATGNETGGPLPGALPGLDSLYIGGVQATVRYAGRSGCCAGVDQIVFDVPAGVPGCYLPVVAVTGGVVSNFGTITVGPACAADQRTGVVTLNGNSDGVDLSGAFYTLDASSVLASPRRVVAPAGSCYLDVTRVGDTQMPQGQGLNAGTAIAINSPAGQWSADNVASGSYFGTKAGAKLGAGTYTFSSAGGSDVGAWSATVNMASTPSTWTNAALFGAPTLSTSAPVTFTWSGGDASGMVTMRLTSANAIYNSSIVCNVAPSAGAFTIPTYLLRAMYVSPADASLTYTAAPVQFSASGLDRGTVTVSNTVKAQTTLTGF